MKHILTTGLSFITITATAQLKKGTWTIGTSTNAPLNLQFNTNGPGFKSYNFSINPTVGYFVNNRLEIGGGPMLSLNGTRYKDNTGQVALRDKQQSFGANIYTRYYLKTEGKFLPYLTANAMYLRSTGHTTDFSGIKSSYKLNEWQVGGGAGLSWFITPKAALFSELNYTGRWGGGLGYTNGLNFKIGFQFYLGKKKGKK